MMRTDGHADECGGREGCHRRLCEYGVFPLTTKLKGQLRAEGKLVSGEAYNMEYHYTVRFDSSGKIRRIDEFIVSLMSAAELCRPDSFLRIPRRHLSC